MNEKSLRGVLAVITFILMLDLAGNRHYYSKDSTVRLPISPRDLI